MWDFEHSPLASALAQRYRLHSTQPSVCADELLANRADLGLIPIASLTPALAIVPGCTIASLDCVRSIQLIIKLKGGSEPNASDSRKRGDRLKSGNAKQHGNRTERKPKPDTEPDEAAVERAMAGVRSIAADTASRSSLAYTQILFRRFLNTDPEFHPAPADPIAMLRQADAALLIGDPALLALEDRVGIESHPEIGPCLWIDIAQQWIRRTHLPWVAAVWAVRPEALVASAIAPAQLIAELQQSRNHGLANIEPLVKEWTPRIALPAATIRRYLTHNIHYTLSPACIEAIHLFRRYAAEDGLLPPLPTLRFL